MNAESVHIRRMRAEDLQAVSELGIQSKASWGYSEEQMKVFTEELTHGPELIDRSLEACVAIEDGQVVGYFTLTWHEDECIELDFMFVAADKFRQGIGTAMMQEAIRLANAHGVVSLRLIADPNAVGFYEGFGATHIGGHQSSIPGRTIPIMKMEIDVDPRW